MDIEKILKAGAAAYIVGIKGTGTSALAELMRGAGIQVSGSDTGEVFYTDSILKELRIPYYEGFDASHIGEGIDIVIHSAAYSAETNCELAEARRRGIPIVKYTDALGAWSASFDSTGIAGVHGKTTTTAIAGALIRAMGLPAQILAGSAVSGFNGRSTLNMGGKYFIAETCEYRGHFLAFHPRRIILTAVESDHQDFFPTYESIRDAFIDYCRLLPQGGCLIYCADDPGASEVAGIIAGENRDIKPVPYGFSAQGDYRVSNYRVENERALFRIACFPEEFALRVPGRHEALNAGAALALTSILLQKEFGENPWTAERRHAAQSALENFKGAKRRSEIIGEAADILFMDDYGHHPTAIKTTLEGLKSFYPARRLVVSFMSHTYTRTASLLDDFAAAFDAADILVLHKIYASARETYTGGVNGRTLYEKIKTLRTAGALHYIEEPLDAFDILKAALEPGDLFLTLGAGSNWPLGLKLFEFFKTEAAG
jgi:UDP-N-acetylmuramate--alanine ligase